MNKRIRKKHRLGEFRELGFELQFDTPAAWTDAQMDDLADRLFAYLDQHALECGGRIGGRWTLFVSGAKRGTSVTPAMRDALVTWLRDQPAVSSVAADPFMDSWYLDARPRIHRRRTR